jgi:hypothetical protein
MSAVVLEHNIDCYYALQQTGSYAPVLVCSCGFKSCEDSWEEAGIGMDEHLRGLPLSAPNGDNQSALRGPE